jgi:hypothetical protein
MFNTKNIITEHQILEKYGELNLWSYFTGNQIVINKKILSPLREERNPSAVFFKSGDRVLLHDFTMGTFNIWQYLRKTKGWSLLQAIKHIQEDLELSKYSGLNKVPYTDSNEVQQAKTRIIISKADWGQEDLDYFSQYYIKRETLDVLNVYPIRGYWILKDEYFYFERKKNELLFAFNPKLGKYKIYRPESVENKFYGNINKNVLFGWESLPLTGDILIITKGIKELAIIRQLGYNSVAIQAEKSFPREDIIQILIQRFNKVYTLMDSDETGQRATLYFKNNYNFKPILLPEETKDLADLSKIFGLKICEELIKKQL